MPFSRSKASNSAHGRVEWPMVQSVPASVASMPHHAGKAFAPDQTPGRAAA